MAKVKSIASGVFNDTPENQFFMDVRKELEYQKQLGWNDEHNTAGAWVCYIVNYVSRWALPASFDTKKYTFYRCMVKTAALCCSAAMWFLTEKEVAEMETVEIPNRVSNIDES
jgi:hypothetical protein